MKRKAKVTAKSEFVHWVDWWSVCRNSWQRMSRLVTQAAELVRARSQRLKQAARSLPGEPVSRGFAGRGALEGYPSHYTSLLSVSRLPHSTVACNNLPSHTFGSPQETPSDLTPLLCRLLVSSRHSCHQVTCKNVTFTVALCQFPSFPVSNK